MASSVSIDGAAPGKLAAHCFRSRPGSRSPAPFSWPSASPTCRWPAASSTAKTSPAFRRWFRQVFYVHAAYIVLVVLGFAVLSLLFPTDLASGRPLGRVLSAFLAVFWLLRVPIQLFYYPVEIRRQNRLADVVFTVAFAFLALVFGLAATR